MDDDFVDPNEHYEDDDRATNSSSDQGTGLEEDRLHRAIGYVAAAAVLIAFAYFYNYGFPGATKPSRDSINANAQSVARDENTSPSGVVANKVEELIGLSVPGAESVDWAKEEEIAANRSAVADFRSKLETISSLSNANTEALVLLQSKVDELRTSEAGAKIASNTEYVQQYIALESNISELKTSSAAVADNFVRDMQALLKRVDAAKDTRYCPKNFVVERAESYLTERSEKAAELKCLDDAVTSLVEKSQELVPGPVLETALREQGKFEEEDLARTLVAARKKALASAKSKLTEAEQERINSETEVQIAKQRVETSNNRALAKEISDKLAVVEARRLKALAKEKLERGFAAANGEIQTYLVYLTADGRSNRGTASGIGPVSYSTVVSSGALGTGQDGIIAMSMWCGSNGRFNRTNNRADNSKISIFSRPMFTDARYEPQIQYIEKAQLLLKKFGPLMVEKGLLAE